MPLWTDLIDPVEATGIARDEQYVIEQAKGGTLARFLPNVFVDSDHVKFYPGSTGLVDAARYRAFNAPPEIGKGVVAKASTIDLPSIARNEPIDEMTQKELARVSEDRLRKSIESAIKRNVQAISQRQEWARGKVINAGSLLVDEDNFWISDVFGRDGSLSASAGSGNWWADPAVDRLMPASQWAKSPHSSRVPSERPKSTSFTWSLTFRRRGAKARAYMAARPGIPIYSSTRWRMPASAKHMSSSGKSSGRLGSALNISSR